MEKSYNEKFYLSDGIYRNDKYNGNEVAELFDAKGKSKSRRFKFVLKLLKTL
jgi:hypothetical protein